MWREGKAELEEEGNGLGGKSTYTRMSKIYHVTCIYSYNKHYPHIHTHNLALK